MDYGTLAGLYRQYLGRDPEPGAEAWLQYDDGTIVNGIVNSEEANNFRNRQQQQPAPPPPEQPPPAAGTDRNTIAQLYRQYLGRDPEPGAYDYWGSRNYNDVVQGITNSAEYAQRLSGQQPAPAQPAESTTGAPSPAQAGFKFDVNNPAAGAVKTDRANGQWTFTYADGSTATYGDYGRAWATMIEGITPPYSAYENPANKQIGYRNIPYASATNFPDTVTVNGAEIPVSKPNLILNTAGKVYTDPNSKQTITYETILPPQGASGADVINSIVGIGIALFVTAVSAQAEVGAAILSSLGADAATISSYANAVGNAITAAGNTAMQQAVNDRSLEDVIKASATAGATAGVSAGAGQAIGSTLPSGLPSSVAGGATGAGVGALSSLVAGKDPLTGAVKGLIPGVVGGGIRDLSGAFDSGDIGEPLYDPVSGRELSPQEVAAMYPDLYPGGVLPKSGQVTEYGPDGSVRYVSTGADIAARTGSVLAGGLVNYLMPTTTPSKVPGTRKTSTTTTATAPTTGTTTTGTPTKTTGASYVLGAPTALSTTGPGSQALSQVLNLGSPTSAYSDVGAEGEALSKETGGKPRNVWNIESLRVKDETGS